MIVYIYGGVSSGKSRYAEELILKNFDNRIYLATMENSGDVSQERIMRHLKQREGKGFTNIEEPENIRNINIKAESNILLEDLTNLLVNNIFYEGGLRIDYNKITESIFSDIIALEKRCNSIFIVGNDVFSTNRHISKELDVFLECLYSLHNKLYDISYMVIEVIYGLPYYRKKNE